MRYRLVDGSGKHCFAAVGLTNVMPQTNAFVLMISTATFWTAAECRQSSAESPTGRVTGAFLQLTPANASNDQATWDSQLEAMRAIGMDTLVVQYVASDDDYYYPTTIGGAKSSPVDVVRHVLDSARRSEIRVFLGLQLDGSFWRGKLDLKKRVQQNSATLDELCQRYGSSPAFAGWYIPEEIDDLTPGRSYANSLLQYLSQITVQAHRKTGLPVMISPYFGQKPDGHAYARWWDEVALPSVDVDIVALQDGVGTHRTTVAESREVFAALAPVMKRHGVAFWANNECFNQTHGSPVDDREWSAQPTDIGTFVRQVQAMSPFVEKSITFEFCHYLDPKRSKTSRALYRGYQNYIRHRSTRQSTFGETNDAKRSH